MAQTGDSFQRLIIPERKSSSGPTLGPIPGCVFEYHGQIPEAVYARPEVFESPLEEAVYNNDVEGFRNLVKQGLGVNVRLKIGQMTCLEYAAMKGYVDILNLLINQSDCATELRQYFALDDIVERAYMISRNKSAFFEREALTEANRYVAALFTAVAYNQPACVRLLLAAVGRREATRNCFDAAVDGKDGKPEVVRTISVGELARSLGHTECYAIVTQCMQQQQLQQQQQSSVTPPSLCV